MSFGTPRVFVGASGMVTAGVGVGVGVPIGKGSERPESYLALQLVL